MKADRKMKSVILRALENFKTRIELEELLRETERLMEGAASFQLSGGYDKFAESLKELECEGYLEPVKRADLNYRNPPLKTKWRKKKSLPKEQWSDGFIMKHSVYMDLSFYRRHKEAQTGLAAVYIQKMHDFMSERKSRLEVSVEERSLEVFGYEKALGSKDSLAAQTMNRVKLTNDDLKMKKYGQMFVYWNRGVENPRCAIILENHSTFYSFKRYVKEYHAVLGIEPDLIIFGNGKQIVKSLQFLDEVALAQNMMLFYFGDLDPVGMQIYLDLKRVYPEMDLNLMLSAYEALLGFSEKMQTCDHAFDERILENFMQEVTDESRTDGQIQVLWNKRKRLAQEHVSYEFLIKG